MGLLCLWSRQRSRPTISAEMETFWQAVSQAELVFLQALDFMRCDWMDVVMLGVTRLGDGGIIWIVFTLCMLFSKRYRRYGLMSAAALLLGLLIVNGMIKPLAARSRPFAVDPSVVLLLAPPGDHSFPSAHTVSSFAAACCIFFGNRKMGTAALVLAGLVAFSRMYLMVHFPTDVLAGVLLGILFAWTARWLVEKIPVLQRK